MSDTNPEVDSAAIEWRSVLGPVLFASLLYLVAAQGLPQSSFDGTLYRVWTESFQTQLAHGVLYPRWLPDLNQGLGSPTFYFYPPFAFYLSAVFRMLGFGLISVNVSMGLTIFSAALAGASGAYLLTRELGASRTDSALVGVLYSQLPYFFFWLLMMRGAYVEFIACGIYPLLLWSAVATRRQGRSHAPWLAILIAVMLGTHPPTALIAIPTSLLFAIAWPSRKPLRWIVLGAGTGALIPALYLSTALTHQEFAPHDVMFLPEMLKHSLFLRASVFTDVGRDLGNSMLNTFSRTNLLMLPAYLATAASALLIAFRSRQARMPKSLNPWMVIGAVCIILFLCHPASMPVWQSVPLLSRLQFAGRLTSTLSIVLLLSIALRVTQWWPKLAHRGTWRSRMSMGAATLTAINFAFAVHIYPQPVNASHYPRARLDAREHRLSGPIEKYSQEEPLFTPDRAELTELRILSGKVSGLVRVSQDSATVVLRQFFYTGWESKVDGETVQLHEPEKGLVQVRLPPGPHEVEFSLLSTRFEQWGRRVSLIGIIVLLSMVAFVTFDTSNKVAVEQTMISWTPHSL